ncbi:MAG: GGDEF domain-containing protein [Eubacterium sp.]|nr:GGDEF domain-containing protein [Eubacterium sp.]
MGDKKFKIVHYAIEISIVIISAILQMAAIKKMVSDQESKSVTLFIVSFILMLIAILYIYILNHRRSLKYEEDAKEQITFSRIANSLAADYDSVYYVNMDDDSYVEYAMKINSLETSKLTPYEGLDVLSSGKDFYADAKINTRKMVYEKDQEKFASVINKERLFEAYKKNEVIHLDYRLVFDGQVVYYNLKVTEGRGEDARYVIIGTRNVDAETRERMNAKEMMRKSLLFTRVADALAVNYEVLYYIDMKTNEYDEFSSSKEYSTLDIGQHGQDFFEDTQKNMARDIYVDDYPMMVQLMKKENFESVLDTSHRVNATYRLVMNGSPEYVELRAIRVKDDERHVILGVVNINDSMKREEELKYKLENVMTMANRDSLTGVKNKNAYNITEKEINQQIIDGQDVEFAVVVCDVNNLKRINDTKGHKVGDEYIREACMMVCKVFKHSPVYRIGGDEFVALMRGDDYDNRRALLQELRTQVEINKEDGMVVLASGMSEYISGVDTCLSDVFEKADEEMYTNKKYLKELV